MEATLTQPEIEISKQTAPAWLVPVFAFILGAVVSAAALQPSIATPDYQRGYAEGMKVGFSEASRNAEQDARQALHSGIALGYEAHRRGEPMPTNPQ